MPLECHGWLLGRGRLPLFYRTWHPHNMSRAAVLITHGLGDHSGRYTSIAQSLAAAGYAVYALDQRGHGRSAGARTAGKFADMIDDLAAMIALIRQGSRSQKVFLVGHSWGGLLTLRYAVDHRNDVDGLVLSAPAARPANVSVARQLLGTALSKIAPNAAVTQIPFDKASRDPRVIEAQRRDPLTTQGPVRAAMAQQTLAAMNRVAAGLPRLCLPTLLLHGSDDVIADPSTSRYVYDAIGSKDKTIKIYQGLWHQLFNEPEQDAVYADVTAWLNRQADHPTHRDSTAIVK
jgi:acylglycerol lipase